MACILYLAVPCKYTAPVAVQFRSVLTDKFSLSHILLVRDYILRKSGAHVLYRCVPRSTGSCCERCHIDLGPVLDAQMQPRCDITVGLFLVSLCHLS